jgi:hypothetical protein
MLWLSGFRLQPGLPAPRVDRKVDRDEVESIVQRVVASAAR